MIKRLRQIQDASKLRSNLIIYRGVIIAALLFLASACAPNTGDVEPILQETGAPTNLPALSTVFPTTAPASKEAKSKLIAESQSEMPPSTPLPTITPIPTSAASDTPTQTAPPPTIEIMLTTEATAIDPSAAKPPPLPTPSGNYSWTLKVPILMYHYISIPPEDSDKYRLDLSVAPLDFRNQMNYLAQNGYETIDLYDLSLAITSKIDLPEKPVIITLDDGYRDNYENAFPILQDYGFEATFFVVTEFIDNNNENYMTWEMVKQMSDAGMRIEPHSKTHADLSLKDKDYTIYEILGSMETIEAHIGERPRFFCYPGGQYNETTIEVLQELDFWGAVTTGSGDWHNFNDRYEWSRSRIRNTTSIAEFKNIVDPGATISGKNTNS